MTNPTNNETNPTMSNVIEALTPEQEAELPRWRKRFLDIGWSTARSDRARAEKGVCGLYDRMKLPHPKFVWVDSPAAAVAIIKESTGQSVALSGVDGSLDAYWVAFYTFCLHIGGKAKEDDIAHLKLWQDIVESTGPCFPYTKICLMTERPCIATYDERERLHGEGAPALQYRDGVAIYAVHGIRVPEKIIMRPWDMTLEEIEACDNEDVRTIMQDAWCYEEKDSTGRRKGAGGGRYLAETGAKTLDLDLYTAYTDEETGESTQIQRALLVDKQNRKFLMCSDSSTDRIYYIRVGDDVTTCKQAHESINGGIPDEKIVISA